MLRRISELAIWLGAFALFPLFMSPLPRAEEPEMRWVRASLAAHAAASAFDGYTSWQHLEGNRVPRSSDGRFGMKAATIKAATFGGVAVVTELLARRERDRGALTIANCAISVMYVGLAVHNGWRR